MAWLWAFGAAWVVVGAATAVVLVRRGHDPGTWAVAGLILGPLSPVLAWAAIRDEARHRATVVGTGRRGPGGTDVLVGVDGSPESAAAVATAVALHGPSLGRLALATVVPFDVADDEEAATLLAAMAGAAAEHAPTTVVLRGEPADGLGRYAVANGFDVLVVGSHGRGRSASPLGSVAARLASDAPVPVLVSPRRAAPGTLRRTGS